MPLNSPCIRNCCLDQDDICLGCGRHLEEITGWQAAGDDRKREILENARLRLLSRPQFPFRSPPQVPQ